jgi:hypothetical protein
VIDYADHPCTCGHHESSHRRALLSCRVKTCECRRFLNRHYLVWLKWIIKTDMHMLGVLERELAQRLKAKAKASKVMKRRAA